MNLSDLQAKLQPELDSQRLGSRVLLDKFRVVDEMSRLSGPYQDPKFLPFYYHLGKFVAPKSLLEIGFRLGLASGCFLQSCKTVNKFLAFQEKDEEFYSPRLAKANIHDVYKSGFDIYVGNIGDQEFQEKMFGVWDMVFIHQNLSHDTHKNYLSLAWHHLAYNGLLVVEHVRKDNEAVYDSFSSFCRIENRDPIYFNTRYGVGIVQK